LITALRLGGAQFGGLVSARPYPSQSRQHDPGGCHLVAYRNTTIALDATEQIKLGVTYNELVASHPFDLKV